MIVSFPKPLNFRTILEIWNTRTTNFWNLQEWYHYNLRIIHYNGVQRPIPRIRSFCFTKDIRILRHPESSSHLNCGRFPKLSALSINQIFWGSLHLKLPFFRESFCRQHNEFLPLVSNPSDSPNPPCLLLGNLRPDGLPWLV